jgi:acetyl esterase/lipase
LKYWRGIYALDGEELKMCVRAGKDWPDEKDRPTQFLSKPGSGLSMVVLRRVRKDYQELGLTPIIADVVFGRKDGLALTLDVYRPTNQANGAVAVWVLSGGFITQTTADPGFVAFHDALLARGYTVIAVRHGSQPRYTVPEIADDVHRAVRFIRSQAANRKLDPDRIGISGHSSGGYLSLFVGVTGDQGKSEDDDPVERLPSRVGAVASYCPPTDFLAFQQFTRDTVPLDIRAAFDFRQFDEAKGIFVPIREESAYREMIRRLSPARRVTKDAAPTLILQGDKDELLTVQQAERMIEKLKAVEVPCELVIKKGAGHEWNLKEDGPRVADWFDRQLAKPKLEKP